MPNEEVDKNKEAKKKLRIAGSDFWAMYDPFTVIDTEREKFQEWLRDKCKDCGVYTDQIENALTGKYRLDDGVDHQCPNPKCNAQLNTGTVKRLPQDFIDEANMKWKPTELAIKKAADEKIKIAKKYGVPPRFIDVQTGEISNDDMEIAKPVKDDKSNDNAE